MMASILFAAALASAGFTVTPVDGGRRFALSTTKSVEELRDVRCRWIFYRDGLPAANGRWNIAGFGTGHVLTNVAPPVLASLRQRGGDLALRVRFVRGAEDPDKETLLAVSQFDYPRQGARPLPSYAGAPATLTETAATYEFKTPSQRIRFDRGTGLLSGFATGWWSLTEWMARPMAFDFGDPSPGVRLESFTKPVETNGVWSFRTVSWWTMSADAEGLRVPKDRPHTGDAVSHRVATKNFELRLTTDWQVRGDGRVVSRTAIRPFGLRARLPRVAWAFVLAAEDPLVQYFGKGAPKGGSASATGSSGEAEFEGLYAASVADCGSHAKTRAVAFDAGMDHFSLSTLGGDFDLEIGTTASKKVFCGIVAARDAETDRDFRLDLLISPEKTLKAYSGTGDE